MPNAGFSRECEEFSQHKLLAAKGFFSALPRFLLFPGNRGAQVLTKKKERGGLSRTRARRVAVPYVRWTPKHDAAEW